MFAQSPERRHGRRVIGWAASLLAAAVALAGCGAGSRPSARPLTIAFHSDPQSLDPHLHDEALTHCILSHFYDGLTAFDAEMRVQPALAESWENPDDVTWRFHLRSAFFHDGRPLGAEDVVASLERARSLPGSKAGGYLVEVKDERVIDSATVEIVTRRPYPILLNKLAFVSIVPRDAPPKIERPVGTGPYVFVSYEPGVGMELREFARRWRAPDIESPVRLLFLSDSAERVSRLISGDVDLITELPVADLDRVAAAPGCGVRSRGGLSVAYLQVRTDRRPFDDLRVRRALSLALDRDALVRHVLGGQGAPAGQMVPPQVFGHVPDIAPPGRDLAEARRLLAAAGLPNGFEFELEYRPGSDLAELRRQLAEAGIRVELRPRPWSELYPRLLAGEVGAYFGNWQSPSGDASDLFDNKVHSRDAAKGYGGSNSNGYSNPALDRLIEQSGETLDMAERRRILEAAVRMLNEDLPLIPIAVPANLYGLRRNLEWRPRLEYGARAYDVRRRER